MVAVFRLNDFPRKLDHRLHWSYTHMITKTLKHGLTLAFVMAFLTACSSSNSKKETDTPVVDNTPVQQDVSDVDVSISNVVYFEFDKYDLTAESRAVLLAHADKLRGASVAVRLEG